MFDEKTRVGEQQNLRGFGDAFAGRGAGHQRRRSARCPPLLRDIDPCAATSPPRTPTSSGSSPRRRARARSSRRSPRSRASLFVNLDPTFAALAEVARPFLQESISEGPPALDAAIRVVPDPAPVPAQHRGSFHELQPGVARAAHCRARPRRRARASARRTLRARPRSTAASRSLLSELQDFAEDPVVPLGLKRPHRRRSRRSNPTLDYLAPAQTHLQLRRRCCSATSPRCCPRATATAPGSGSSSSPRRRAPTTRAARPRRPPTARRSDNYLHSNPYPNTASPGPAQGVRGRQRAATPPAAR